MGLGITIHEDTSGVMRELWRIGIMATCRICGEDFRYGEYYSFGICDDCAKRQRNKYPFNGEECGICGGIIRHRYTRQYVATYECDTCGTRWSYD